MLRACLPAAHPRQGTTQDILALFGRGSSASCIPTTVASARETSKLLHCSSLTFGRDCCAQHQAACGHGWADLLSTACNRGTGLLDSALCTAILQIRKQLLSFVIVGGGPTGIEVAAELHDMITGDLSKIYPQLMGDVNIRIIELQDHILSTYDREISNYTQQQFGRCAVRSLHLPPLLLPALQTARFDDIQSVRYCPRLMALTQTRLGACSFHRARQAPTRLHQQL